MLYSRFYVKLVPLAILFASGCLPAQSFIESYSYRPETGDDGEHIVTIDSNIYMHAVSVVPAPFEHVEGGLVKLDWLGHLEWWNIWNFDFGYVGTSFANGIVATEDTIYTTGNYLRLTDTVFSPAIVANAVDDGLVRGIQFPYDHRASIKDIFLNSDTTFTTISEDWESDSFDFPIIVDRIDLSGRSTSSMEYLTELSVLYFAKSTRDQNGNIYTAFRGCIGPDANCYHGQGWLSRINADGTFAWKRSYGYTSYTQQVFPEIAVLNDTTLAYAWTRDTNNLDIQESPPIVYYLDTLGNRRDSFAFHGNWRTTNKIISCANGDVVGVGYAWTDIGYTGWMFRLDGYGNLVWERYIQDHRQTTGTSTNLAAVTEAADGSIIACGNIFHSQPPRDGGGRLRAWVVKLDADGCYEPACVSDTIYLEAPDAVEDGPIDTPDAVRVWPNPTDSDLYWSIPALAPYDRINEFRIISAAGYAVQVGRVSPGERVVDVSTLPSGVYFFNLYENGKPRGGTKFIKR